MELPELKATLTGKAPLLMHNGQLADPTNKWTRELAKHTKGKAKDPEMARKIEFLGSLYTGTAFKGTKPYECPGITGDMLYSCVIQGARARKLGKAAAAGVIDGAPFFPLHYEGPTDALELYEHGEFSDYRGVRIGQVRVMRSRPIFRKWAVDVRLQFDDSLISRDDLILALERAGLACGLGDYRPRFGRFTVEVKP